MNLSCNIGVKNMMKICENMMKDPVHHVWLPVAEVQAIIEGFVKSKGDIQD